MTRLPQSSGKREGMTIDKVLGFVGLAKKAGKAMTGEDNCKELIRSGACRLVLLAEDAGPNTRKSMENSCAYYKVPLLTYGDKLTLGQAVGRKVAAVISISDQGFADGIEKRIGANINGGE